MPQVSKGDSVVRQRSPRVHSWPTRILKPLSGLLHGCLEETRPIVMACVCAASGLLPAALSNGIGAQAQQPLARVVVGGTMKTLFAVLFITPLLARHLPGRAKSESTESEF